MIECAEGGDCTEPGTETEEPGTEAGAEARATAASVNSCIVWGGTATYVSSTRPMAKIAATFALGSASASKARLVYTTTKSHSTTAGVVMSSNGASWSKKGTKSMSSTWEYAWNYNTAKHRSYYVQIDYGKYRQKYVRQVMSNGKCTSFVESIGTGYWYKPRFETGGVKSTNNTAPNPYTHCVPVADGLWTRVSTSGTAYSNSGGANISGTVGFDLSVKSNFSSAKKVQYDVAGNKRMCGRSTGPLLDAVPMLRFPA